MGFWLTFFLWVASFVIADYFRPKLPSQEPSGQGDFKFPTSTQGRKIPVVLGGTIKMESPNTLWYGEWEAQEVTVETGVVFKKDETVGYTYSVAIALGQFFGPSAGMTRIWIGDDVVWDYDTDNGGVPATLADVDLPDLFGGERQGGGFSGRFRAFTGEDNQSASTFLSSRITNQSSWPGLTYVVLTSLDETGGATIGEANQLRDIRIEWQTFDTVANGGLGDDLQLANNHHFINRDANPINIAYKVWTDQEYGIGAGVGDIDVPNFQSVAETCWTEGLGYSQIIDNEIDAYEILNQIEKHIDGYIGPDPVTGKIQITLARSGYNPATEFQADETNIIAVRNYSKPEWPQVKNEVKVQYIDRDKRYNDTYAIAQDMAGRLITGRPQSVTVRFPGVRDKNVANRIVARISRAYFWPLAKFQLEMDRTAYSLTPGKVVMVNDPDIGAVDLPTRVTRISQGDPVTQSIKVDVVEDVFADEVGLIAAPPDNEFVPPVQTVDPFALAEQWAMEAPFIINRQDEAYANIYPRVVTAGARQGGGSITEYEVIRRTGNPPSGAYASADFIPWSGGMLVGQLRNAENGLTAGDINGGYNIQVDPVVGSLDTIIGGQSPGSQNMAGVCVIDPGGPNEEWVVTTNIVDDLTGIRLEDVWRGAMDTWIKPHAANEKIWFIWTGGFGSLPIQETSGTDAGVKLLPRSSSDAITEPEATEIVVDVEANPRYIRPLLPLYITMNGFRWPSSVDYDSVIDSEPPDGTPDAQGVKIAPRLRDWRNQDVLDQVQGGGIRGDIWSDDGHIINYWIYNLDRTPNPSRGVDEIDSGSLSATFATTGIYDSLKATVAQEFIDAEANSLNFRLEIETSHVPGFGLPTYISRETIEYDFTATGTFIIPPENVYVHVRFESPNAEGDVFAFDNSANNHIIEFINGDIRVTATPAPSIGTLSVNLGEDNSTVLPANSSSYLALPNTSDITGDLDWDQDFTIEFRVYIDSLSGGGALVGQGGSSSGGNTCYVDYTSGGILRILTNGTTRTFTHTALVINTWYAVMVTRKINADTTVSYRLHIDGILQDTITVAAHTIPLNTTAPLTIGAVDYNRSLVSGVTTSGPTGANIDEVRVILGSARELVDFVLETESFETPSEGIVVAQTRLEWEHNQNAKLTNDLASTDTAWVYDGVCSISALESKFGRTSLFVNGISNTTSGMRWGNFETFDQQKHQYLNNKDFTIEGWVNFSTLPSGGNGLGMVMVGAGDNSPAVRSWYFGFDENNELEFAYSHTGTAWENVATATTTPALSTGQWYWLTACRSGDALECWLDGTRYINEATFFQANPTIYNSTGDSSSTSPICLGKAGYQASSAAEYRSLHGYIDDYRQTKRIARYTGASITVPTEYLPSPNRINVRPFFGIPQKEDVVHHFHFNTEDENYDPYFNEVISILEFEGADTATTTTDLKNSGRTWTFSGNAQIDTAQFSIGTSSLLLDGTGDYIDCGDDTAFDWPDDTVDWTIEMDVRFNTVTGTQTLISKAEATGPRWVWQFAGGTNQLQFNVSTNGSNNSTANFSWTPSTATWYNIVLQKSAGRLYLWIDGVFQSEQTTFTIGTSAETNPVVIGARNTGGTAINFFDGHIDHFRFTLEERHGECNDTDRFGDIDPVDFAFALREGHPHDKHMYNTAVGALEHVQSTTGNPFLDRAQKKFGTASLYLDGIDDYLQISNGGVNLDVDAFTIEAQVRFEVAPGVGNMTIASQWNTQFNARGWILAVRNNVLTFEWDDSFSQFTATGSWTPVADTWYHVMVCRVQGALRLFVDGTQVGSTYYHVSTDRQISNSSTSTNIGVHFVANAPTDLFNGWIDEFRIVRPAEASSNGRAWHPYFFPDANFTAPTDEYDFHRIISFFRSRPGVARLGRPTDWSENADYDVTAGTINSQGLIDSLVDAELKFPRSTWYQQKYGSCPIPNVMSQTGATGYTFSPAVTDNRNLRSKAFTFDGWFRWTTDPNGTTQAFWSHYDDSGNNRSFIFYYDATNDDLRLTWYDGTTALGTRTWTWADPAINTWYHLALVRNGDDLDVYLDGTLLTAGGDALPTNYEFFQAVENWGIGVGDVDFAGGNPFWQWRGQMSEVRITWKPLYTGNFTPPANPNLTFGRCVE